MKLNHIQVSDSLEGIARIGVVLLKNLTNGPSTPSLRERVDGMASELRHSIGSRTLSEIESVQLTRKLYHSLGIDPTKDRPGSERLLRRIVQGRGLSTVNQLVDVTNLVSLSTQFPMSVYDWDKISPPVLVRVGRPKESLIATGDYQFRAAGRLVLVDGESLFGNPSHDAERTRVDDGTVRAMVLVWMPADTSNQRIETVLQDTIAATQEFCDAQVAQSGILF